MNLGTVAIVGRPNVGKSTLFNRIAKRKLAIVDFEEGVTRDRKYEEIEWNGKVFVLIDTGGIIPGSDDSLDKAVKFQAEIAIDEAEVIVFLVDAKVGVTDIDMKISSILRPVHDKVLLVANKTDNEKDQLEIFDFMQLGFGEPFPIAAVNGRNIGNFMDLLLESVTTLDQLMRDDDSIKVSIVGKPNVGKSSIVNRLIGQDTVIVNDAPGTTRDTVDSKMRYKQQTITFIDTAGLRRKTKVNYGVEYFSVMRTIYSIKRSDIVILVIDAQDGITSQDQKIASYIKRNYRNVIIVFNKWDLIEKDNHTVGKFIDMIKEQLPFLQYAPVMFVSALTNLRVHGLLEKVIEVNTESHERIKTAEMNKFLEMVTKKLPPSHPSGKHVKIYYCTQQKVHPPTFIFFVNEAKLITEKYRKYLYNQIMEHFSFKGVTIKINFRGKKDAEKEIEEFAD